MIIFNNTDHPVTVILGDCSFVIEARRHWEEPIPEVEYPFCVNKLQKGGKLRRFRGKTDDDWGTWGYHLCPCLGFSGTLTVEWDTKLHVSERYRRLYFIGRQRRELEYLDCTVENGNLKNAKHYFTSAYLRNRELLENYLLLGILILLNLAVLSIPQYDIATFVFKFLFQGFCLLFDWQCIRVIRILREYPVKKG